MIVYIIHSVETNEQRSLGLTILKLFIRTNNFTNGKLSFVYYLYEGESLPLGGEIFWTEYGIVLPVQW